jgi:hypothetical protein
MGPVSVTAFYPGISFLTLFILHVLLEKQSFFVGLVHYAMTFFLTTGEPVFICILNPLAIRLISVSAGSGSSAYVITLR